MENRCSICHVEGEVFDAIAKDEIVSVCKICADKNDLPIIQKPTQEQINRAHRFRPVHERLSIAAGIKPKEEGVSQKELDKMIIQKTIKKEYSELIDNFHWHIQQARRFKHLSQKQIAEAIGEPEVLVAMAEEAKLPEDYDKLLNKLEQYLKIQLRKEPKKSDAISGGVFDIDKADLSNVTIGDLKKVNEEMIISDVEQKMNRQPKKGFWSRWFGSEDEEVLEDSEIEDVEELR